MSKIETTYGECDTDTDGGVLPILEAGRVLSVRKEGDSFVLMESCDYCFKVTLSCEQMGMLIAELSALTSTA